MAQKKKTTTRRKKVAEPVIQERSPFWSLSFAVLLCVIALFVLLGGFGTGGALPKGLFDGGFWLVGWAAYLIPVVLVYWAVYKFRSEDHRIPAGKMFGIIAVEVFLSCFLFTAFAAKQGTEWANGYGGSIGSAVGGMALGLLDKAPASIMFLIFTTLAVFFAFAISPKVLLRIGELFKQPIHEGDTDISQLRSKAESSGFKLNEGVPIEHKPQEVERPRPARLTSLKNSAEKQPPAESHEALTTASDPDWKYPNTSLLDQKQDKADAGRCQWQCPNNS